MSMVTRDIMAATLLVAGVASLSYGAYLIAPAAGLIVLGVMLSLLGATLGFWEGGTNAAEPTPEPAVEPPPAPTWDPDDDEEAEGREDEIVYPAPPPRRTGPPGPAEVPFGSYLGVRSKEEAR